MFIFWENNIISKAQKTRGNCINNYNYLCKESYSGYTFIRNAVF